MEKVVSLIINISGDSSELLEQLQSELSKNRDVLVKAIGQVDYALASLDPKKHSLGFLHILSLLCDKRILARFDLEVFVAQVSRFLIECSARQIRYDPKKFSLVCHHFANVCREMKQPIRAVKPLKQAIWKVAAGDQLTPQHQLFAMSCLLSKNYKQAVSVLNRFVYEVEPSKSAITSEDTRLYFYYGAMIYIGLKQYNKALEFLEFVIGAPAHAASAIMAEAYKKYVLISLIVKGEVSELPNYTNQQVLRILKQLNAPYDELATSFQTRSVEDLLKVMSNREEVFVRDSNLGLVKQVVNAVHDQNILKLPLVYLTITLEEVAKHTGLKDIREAESRIVRLVDRGILRARIHQKEGYVEFPPTPELYNTNNSVKILEENVSGTINVTRKVHNIDEAIGLSQHYLQKVLQAEKAGPSGRTGDDEDRPAQTAGAGSSRGQ